MSFSSNNSSSNSMGPLPNQQPRQLPSGGNGHRKSSSLNRGWFEGTMEVISGMAPRPVTPSQNHIRSASAPNSPARGLGMGLFGVGGRNSPHHPFPPHIDRSNSGGSAGGGSFALPNFPINRLPSQDSLDRSIHNESGHGKSTAQIIRDLKHSNSALSAKMASLEKRHMNDLAKVEAASSSKRQELEQISTKQKMKLMQYEQYKAAAETKMKQQDAELSKIKEESAFQRHSISDLKNQLYQLQQELDERDGDDENKVDGNNNGADDDIRRPHSDKGHNLPLHPSFSRGNNDLVIAPTSSSMSTDDLQQMALDNEELVKEIQELQDQLMEYRGYDKKLNDLQRQLEAAQKTSNGSDVVIIPRPTAPTHLHLKNQPEHERPPLAPSKTRDEDESESVMPTDSNRKQLQDVKEEFHTSTLKSYQHEHILRNLEIEKESLAEAHSRRVQELENRFVLLEEQSKERELALRKELTSLSQQEINQIETRLREDQQVQVIELEDQLEQYAEKLAEVAATLAESRQQAKNQEQYRKDEAEDLRMIQDALEAEIVRLEKEVEEATKELELRDEELEESKQKILFLLQEEKEDEKKSEESDTERPMIITDESAEEMNDSHKKALSNLEEQLHNSLVTVNKLESRLISLRKEHNDSIAKLEMENTELQSDLTTAQETYAHLQQEKTEDSTDLHRYWEEKTSKTKEVETLKIEIENMRQRVHESTDKWKLAEQKIQDLQTQLQPFQAVETNTGSNELTEELKFAKTRIAEAEEEIVRLEGKIEQLNVLSVQNEGFKKDLQEAQTALVELGDDKQTMRNEMTEVLSSFEKEKKTHNEMMAQIERQKEELTELHNTKSLVKHLETERRRLQSEIEKLKNSCNHDGTSNSLDIFGSLGSIKVRDIKQDLEQQIEDLNEDKSMMKAKLNDRNTTIATLLRSSIILENKIESLQGEVHESTALFEKSINELQELKYIQGNRDKEYSKAGEEIKYLRGQLEIAKVDAKRWKRALKDDGTSNGEYRYQISMLQKTNDDIAETIRERDRAIQNLVNQSMGQELHVRDLKIRISSLMKEVESMREEKESTNDCLLRAEIDRLQEESEIFAGQIIEQDEEFKRVQQVLIKREEQISSLKIAIEVCNRRKNCRDNNVLGQDHQSLKKIDSLERQKKTNTDGVDRIEIENLRAELDEMQEAAESNRIEIRDLRQQLWEAKDMAGSSSDLRVQLEQTKWEFNQYERKDMANDELQINLEKSLGRIKELEVILTKNESTESKINDLKTELQDHESIIKEPREHLPYSCTINEEFDAVGNTENLEKEQIDVKNKRSDLESQFQSKLFECKSLRGELDTLKLEIVSARELLQSNEIEKIEVFEQIMASQNEISNFTQLENDLSTSSQLSNETKFSQGYTTAFITFIKTTTCDIKSLHKQICMLQDQAVSVRKNLDGKTKRIERFENEASILAHEIDIAKVNLKAKEKNVDDLEKRLQANMIQLEEAGHLKAKLGNELADSQARLGALERELSDAITETSCHEQPSRKNQSLVQENASLAQKNESLLQGNALLESANKSLVEESKTLTKDNHVLCEELKLLGKENTYRELELKSLTVKNKYLVGLNKSISCEKIESDERVTSLAENIQALNKCNYTLHQDVETLSKENEDFRCRNFDSIQDQKDAAVDHNDLLQKLEDMTRVTDSLSKANEFLVEKNKELINNVGHLEEKNKNLAGDGSRMEKSIATLKVDIQKLTEGASELETLQTKLHESEIHRQSSEKTLVENYETKLQSLLSCKDSEIDFLRNDLTETRRVNCENAGKVKAQLRTMKEENNSLRNRLEFELHAKDQQIFALEHTLHAQEQIVDTMKSEMDQIQSGMEHATKSRRNEVEEMQQEVIQVEANAMKQEREIVALKMQLEERKLEHKADVVKLKDALAKAIEQDSPLKQTISDLHYNDRMLEVRERLEQLKVRNTDLQEENLSLGGRLERARIQISTLEVEKQQAEEVEDENMKLRNQLKEYEQLFSKTTTQARNSNLPVPWNANTSGKYDATKAKKKKKFGLFKRRNTDEYISEGKEEEEC